MATPKDLERIAAAMHALRPDWPEKSLVTFLTNHHSHRPWRDLAVAATAVATDTRTRTPNLLNEHGSWWVAAHTATGTTGEPSLFDERCPLPGHSSYPADNCGACRSEQIETPVPRKAWDREEPSYVVGPKLVREAMRQAGIPVKPRNQP
jgi:hypothetical protein